MEKIITYLLSVKTWRHVAIIVSVLFSGLLAYTGYKVVNYVETLELVSGVKRVEFTEKQQSLVQEVVDEVVDHNNVCEFYIRVLQPDKIRKEYSELIYGRTKTCNWEYIQDNHWSKLNLELYQTPSVIIKLNQSQIYFINKDDSSYVGRYLAGIDHEYSTVFLKGLYINNFLVGYCTIFMNGSASEDDKTATFKTIRRVNTILFNY